MKCRPCDAQMAPDAKEPNVLVCPRCFGAVVMRDAALLTAPIPLPARWKLEPPTLAELSSREDAS